jgi:predicted secreted protein
MDELNAKLNQPFEITLASKALAGYEWKPVFNTFALKLLGTRRTRGKRSFGASGQEIFRFEAVRPGDYDISFELKRPFEKGPVERRNFSLHVQTP